MACPNCGNEIIDNRRFCGKCGTEVNAPAPAPAPPPAPAAPTSWGAPGTWGAPASPTPTPPPPGSASPPGPAAPAAPSDPFAPPDLYGPPPGAAGPPPAPGYPPPGYAAQGYPPGAWPGGAYPQHTNGFAVASLVLGLLGWVPCGIGSVLAIVFGFVAREQIKRSQGREGGQGMATAGIVLGFVAVGLWLLFFVISLAASGSNA